MRGGTNVGAAPTTNNDDAVVSQNDDDENNNNLLSIKVRSHDPVGEYAFSVSKTVRKYVFCVSIVSLSSLLFVSRVFFPRFV